MLNLLIVCRGGEMLTALQDSANALTTPAETTIFHSAVDTLCHFAADGTPTYDMAIINAPLPDEYGNELARKLYDSFGIPSVLLTPAEYLEEIERYFEGIPCFPLAKPIGKNTLTQGIQLACGAFRHISRLSTENEALQKKIEDFKVIDRAKCTLVGVLKMNEQQAHRYIQKQAMDQRVKPRVIADSILKTYEF